MQFEEKTREEKEAFASKRMAEMKLKNEKLRERYKEVQRDRERAEERNSSITLGRNIRKETDKEFSPKTKPEREWDRGKPNMDSADWDSKHQDYYPPRNTRAYSDRRNRKDDNWRSRPNTSSSRPTSSFFSKYSNKNETSHESSTHRNDGNHFNNRSRSQYYSSNSAKNPTDSHSQSYHNSKVEDHPQKFSSTQVSSDMKKEPAEGVDELMWQSGSMIEAQIKFNRIENWVKSINMNQGFTESAEVTNAKEEYKSHGRGRDVGFHREKPKKFGMNEDTTPKKSKEQGYFRNRDKTVQSFVANPSARRKRVRERVPSVSETKNFRDMKRKNATDRPRRKCESDMSDHASSMKESDDTMHHNSKSSNNFNQHDKRVDYNIDDPWESEVNSNGNVKEFSHLEGDEGWVDWGADQQPKDMKQNSQNKFESKPSECKSKYNNNNSNWTESNHQHNKFSKNNENSSKRSMHRRKFGNDNISHSSQSRGVSSQANIVHEELDEIWDPVSKRNDQEELDEKWDSVCKSNGGQEELDGIWDSVCKSNGGQEELDGIWEPVRKSKGGKEKLDEKWDTVCKSNEGQEELDEIWEPVRKSNEGQEELDEIWDPVRKSNGGQEKLGEKGILEKNANSVVPNPKQEGCCNPDLEEGLEVDETLEPVATQDSCDVIKDEKGDKTDTLQVVSSDNLKPMDKNESTCCNLVQEKHSNNSISCDHSEKSKATSFQEKLGENSEPVMSECDKLVQSDPELQKTDNCNKPSDSNYLIVNYDGSGDGISKSTNQDFLVNENLDQFESDHLNEKSSCEEIEMLNENSILHTEIGNEVLEESNEDLSLKSEVEKSEKNCLQVTVDSNVQSNDSEPLVNRSHDNQSNKVCGKILVSEQKIIGEPDVCALNSDDDGWSTVTEEEDDKTLPTS